MGTVVCASVVPLVVVPGMPVVPGIVVPGEAVVPGCVVVIGSLVVVSVVLVVTVVSSTFPSSGEHAVMDAADKRKSSRKTATTRTLICNLLMIVKILSLCIEAIPYNAVRRISEICFWLRLQRKRSVLRLDDTVGVMRYCSDYT